MPSRRAFLGTSLAAAGGLLLPRRLAAAAGSDRKFLFVYVQGGWDPTYVFAPIFGSDAVDMDSTAQLGTVGDLSFTDSNERPSVRSFLEGYGSRVAFLNGFEVRSITHERCRRIMFTGTSASVADDWPAIAAGNAPGYLFPTLVISGPSYTSAYSSTVIRVGESGQLGPLLDGKALDNAEPAMESLSQTADDIVSARVASRVARARVGAAPGRSRAFLDAYGTSLQQSAALQSLAGSLDFSADDAGGCTELKYVISPGLTCLEQGYSRCVVVQTAGWCDQGWDSHSGIGIQSTNFELLFDDLTMIMGELDSRTGTSGKPLSEEVTVVVLSEMGRTPKLNATGGKDHWTYTSAMLIGPGVRGGRIVGAYDSGLSGAPIDFETGVADDAGQIPTAGNFGATLLSIAGIDPAEFTPDEPIAALMSD